MEIIDGVKYYKAREIARMIKKEEQTFNLYDKYSNELEERGEPRIIPKPVRIGPKNTRYWTESQLEEIKKFVSSLGYGSMAEFNRSRWGRRSTVKTK